ncbi:MAG: hypothetical protein P4L26_00705 [Terracidiphilus sp.]|nr:hypothetical protein [Terracidiphilus sp.]
MQQTLAIRSQESCALHDAGKLYQTPNFKGLVTGPDFSRADRAIQIDVGLFRISRAESSTQLTSMEWQDFRVSAETGGFGVFGLCHLIAAKREYHR